MSKKFRLGLIVTTFALLAVATAGYVVFGEAGNSENYARAEYSVKNLSCGSCVRNIQKALETVPGTGKVEVSVTLGWATVEYDPSRISDQKIARVISEAGYPATTIQNLTAEEYRSLKTDESLLAAKYVARIGGHLLPREDFEKELSLKTGSKGRATPSPRLLQVVWEKFYQQELLLLAAEKNQVVVSDAEVEREVEGMRKGNDNFDALVSARFGSMDAFSRKLRTDMVISRTIEEHVLQGAGKGPFRRQKLDNWFRELSASTPVTIFDPALKAALETGSGGCGGSCCG